MMVIVLLNIYLDLPVYWIEALDDLSPLAQRIDLILLVILWHLISFASVIAILDLTPSAFHRPEIVQRPPSLFYFLI